ncbi:alpha-L-arabinofuranosidase C-terminal domain-containing protein [Puia dinghuensis]|uniref:non-reducing end alpha-L-arabinofuranosidase n=1 Tax=Puia dinghuensis TaxID=1792502 RepID=A0A8J2UCW7_9BACT|nr:alpha-L-arabinofuranosidase C-terminal domain-containing protein [Puia dinghuensis]GGA98280.1 hypothetical protein GCM10011511_21990 [Puia dinghuensis]
MLRCLSFPITITAFLCFSLRLPAQSPARLTLHLDQPGAAVSPGLYGLMTEEINFSYEGGLYGELIRNRSFKDSAKTAAFWSLLPGGSTSAKATMSLDKEKPVGPALPVSLRVDVTEAGDGVGIANEGYWGMAVRPNTTYKGSLFARGSGGSGQPLSVSLQSKDGKTVFASAEVAAPGTEWAPVHFSLVTGAGVQPTADARFVIRARAAGSYWFSLVSLFPPTYKDRLNGNRPDIMQLLADMKPAFLRLPGGNYLEGNTFSQRWDWKKTIGPVEQRPGHLSPWHYRSTDGMGLLEFLGWCEDLHMEPVLAVFAGYVLNRDYIEAGPFLQPFVDDAVDEIEYVTGDVHTKWGARRAADGHPDPFPLHYIEIGNEDGFDASGSYEGRYAQFYDAIKAKYPQLHIISTVGGKDGLGGRFPAPAGRTEIVDEHYYRNAWQMEENAGQYDHYDRSGPKVFVGEWATREGDPTTNFNAALGDAAWMTGMERNSDLVIMSCYAPLFVNVNPGGMQWRSDLIGYNALTSFGSPSYYAQQLFSTHLGDSIVRLSWENIPTQTQQLTAKDSAAGVQPKKIDALFFSATRDTKKGVIHLKVVNTQGVDQNMMIDVAGAGKVATAGVAWTLNADSPTETNTISEPTKIVPVKYGVRGLGKSFRWTFPAYSIMVMDIPFTAR